MLPESGKITMLDIIEEIDGERIPRKICLGDEDVRELADIPSGPIKISDLYGKSSLDLFAGHARIDPIHDCKYSQTYMDFNLNCISDDGLYFSFYNITYATILIYKRDKRTSLELNLILTQKLDKSLLTDNIKIIDIKISPNCKNLLIITRNNNLNTDNVYHYKIDLYNYTCNLNSSYEFSNINQSLDVECFNEYALLIKTPDSDSSNTTAEKALILEQFDYTKFDKLRKTIKIIVSNYTKIGMFRMHFPYVYIDNVENNKIYKIQLNDNLEKINETTFNFTFDTIYRPYRMVKNLIMSNQGNCYVYPNNDYAVRKYDIFTINDNNPKLLQSIHLESIDPSLSKYFNANDKNAYGFPYSVNCQFSRSDKYLFFKVKNLYEPNINIQNTYISCVFIFKKNKLGTYEYLNKIYDIANNNTTKYAGFYDSNIYSDKRESIFGISIPKARNSKIQPNVFFGQFNKCMKYSHVRPTSFYGYVNDNKTWYNGNFGAYISGDGNILVTRRKILSSGLYGLAIYQWKTNHWSDDYNNIIPLTAEDAHGDTNGISISETGKVIIYKSQQKYKILYRISTNDWRNTSVLPVPDSIKYFNNNKIALSADGKTVVIGAIGRDNTYQVVVFSIDKGVVTNQHIYKSSDTLYGNNVQISPDGLKLIVTTNRQILIYDFSNRVISPNTLIQAIPLPKQTLTYAAPQIPIAISYTGDVFSFVYPMENKLFIYRKNKDINSWEQTSISGVDLKKIDPDLTNVCVGNHHSLSYDGNTLAFTSNNNSLIIYKYDQKSNVWINYAIKYAISPDNENSYGEYGCQMDGSGNKIVVSQPKFKYYDVTKGNIYTYTTIQPYITNLIQYKKKYSRGFHRFIIPENCRYMEYTLTAGGAGGHTAGATGNHRFGGAGGFGAYGYGSINVEPGNVVEIYVGVGGAVNRPGTNSSITISGKAILTVGGGQVGYTHDCTTIPPDPNWFNIKHAGGLGGRVLLDWRSKVSVKGKRPVGQDSETRPKAGVGGNGENIPYSGPHEYAQNGCDGEVIISLYSHNNTSIDFTDKFIQ